MTNRDIALEYLHCFCDSDIDGIEDLIADDMVFAGPLHTFSTAAEYLDSLRANPPENIEYDLLSVTESDDNVALFYVYHKPQLAMFIAQLFKFSEEKITAILAVFDSRDIG